MPLWQKREDQQQVHRTALQQTLRDNPATCHWRGNRVQVSPFSMLPELTNPMKLCSQATLLPALYFPAVKEHTAHSFDKNPLMSLEPCPSLVKRLHCIVCSFMLQHHKQIWL